MRTVVNTVNALGTEYDFHILSRDHDGFSDVSPYPDVVYDAWTSVGAAKVRYLRSDEIRPSTVAAVVREYDWDSIYLNSLFSTLSIIFFSLRFLGFVKPPSVGVAPCGELSDGALAKGRLKKFIFLFFSRLVGLHRGISWRASDESERKQIQKVFKTETVSLAPDISLPLIATPFERSPKTTGILRLVFLSRLVPKKNLLFLIDRLREVAGDVTLTVIGPFESTGYQKLVHRSISSLPPDKKVFFSGPVPYGNLFEHLANQDFFVLPSLGENFGHVIAEALSASCPVVISDRTPWQDLESRRAGFVIPLENEERWVETLNGLVGMDEREHSALRLGAQEMSREIFADSRATDLTREFFRELTLKSERASK